MATALQFPWAAKAPPRPLGQVDELTRRGRADIIRIGPGVAIFVKRTRTPTPQKSAETDFASPRPAAPPASAETRTVLEN